MALIGSERHREDSRRLGRNRVDGHFLRGRNELGDLVARWIADIKISVDALKQRTRALHGRQRSSWVIVPLVVMRPILFEVAFRKPHGAVGSGSDAAQARRRRRDRKFADRAGRRELADFISVHLDEPERTIGSADDRLRFAFGVVSPKKVGIAVPGVRRQTPFAPLSVTQRFPSPPWATNWGAEPAAGNGTSVNPAPAYRPYLPTADSANERAPSAASAIPSGALFAVGIGKSITVPAVVRFPRRPTVCSVKYREPSVARVMPAGPALASGRRTRSSPAAGRASRGPSWHS